MFGSIRVVNRFSKKNHPTVIRKMITRSASPVGNPFVMGQDGDRDYCLGRFGQLVKDGWLEGKWDDKQREWMNQRAEEYLRGEDIELVCGCAPQKCHGDILRDAIIEIAERDQACTHNLVGGIRYG